MATMFTVQISGQVAVVTFTRPPQNWMSVAALTELIEVLTELSQRQDDVTLVILTGGVDGYFVAKKAVVEGLRLRFDDGLQLEKVLFDELNASPEAKARNIQFPRPA
jgi:enoyl-CoA hydratase/carnithine racemase